VLFSESVTKDLVHITTNCPLTLPYPFHRKDSVRRYRGTLSRLPLRCENSYVPVFIIYYYYYYTLDDTLLLLLLLLIVFLLSLFPYALRVRTPRTGSPTPSPMRTKTERYIAFHRLGRGPRPLPVLVYTLRVVRRHQSVVAIRLRAWYVCVVVSAVRAPRVPSVSNRPCYVQSTYNIRWTSSTTL